eukprot:Lithocolla_globosa_v1_NODE_3486_length_1658_cov_8.762944.p1 type:complete len:175 gc:universal NODE_3486_length_1658_cov_8.762944:771-1295(+)
MKEMDWFVWRANLVAPPGPYEGALLSLTILFPSNYPNRAPEVSFNTPVYHPWVNKKGRIMLGDLKDDWSSSFSVGVLLYEVCRMLTDIHQTFIGDPLNPDPYFEYKKSSQDFLSTAQRQTLADFPRAPHTWTTDTHSLWTPFFKEQVRQVLLCNQRMWALSWVVLRKIIHFLWL